MLRLLHIENIAVIEQADILFERGFNVMTGETGAGKSIVIDAMNLALGERADRDLIRAGQEKARVEALFDVSGCEAAVQELEGMGVDVSDGQLVVTRELSLSGRNVVRLNGNLTPLAGLKAVSSLLVDVHGQHEHQSLMNEEKHLGFLDGFAQAAIAPLRQEVAERYAAWRKLAERYRRVVGGARQRAQRLDMLRFQVGEIENARLHPGEEEELTARRGMLRNAEKFLDAVAGADYALNGDDSGGGALSALRQAQDALGGVRHLDDAFGQLYERLGEAYSEVYDIAATVEDKRGELDVSPGELDRVESRMDLLYRLKKKYGATVEDMLDYQARCEAELAQIEDAGDTLARLEQALSKAEKEARQAAQALSDARKAAAEQLTSQILAELQQLDMGKIRFAVDFAEKPLDSDGMDTVRFLMSANVGEELRPIHKIASGGELARIMLAMKNVLSEQDHVGTMVFDEVDTGVSGRAAQKVAEKMARISRRKQVLCVTHLPQLAAMADTHFSVEKGERGGRTYTEVRRLDREQRRRELARLTGGSHVSQTMLDGAEELLVQAEKFRAEL